MSLAESDAECFLAFQNAIERKKARRVMKTATSTAQVRAEIPSEIFSTLNREGVPATNFINFVQHLI
jgi:hypothetical protein